LEAQSIGQANAFVVQRGEKITVICNLDSFAKKKENEPLLIFQKMPSEGNETNLFSFPNHHFWFHKLGL